VQLFADNHLSCLFFQQDGPSFEDFQEFVIGNAASPFQFLLYWSGKGRYRWSRPCLFCNSTL
jgi:hypothetical protein